MGVDDVRPLASCDLRHELAIAADHVHPRPVRGQPSLSLVGPRDVVAPIVPDAVDVVDRVPIRAGKEGRRHDDWIEPQQTLVFDDVAAAHRVADELGCRPLEDVEHFHAVTIDDRTPATLVGHGRPFTTSWTPSRSLTCKRFERASSSAISQRSSASTTLSIVAGASICSRPSSESARKRLPQTAGRLPGAVRWKQQGALEVAALRVERAEPASPIEEVFLATLASFHANAHRAPAPCRPSDALLERSSSGSRDRIAPRTRAAARSA